jgi:hypothetical protein
MIHELKAKIADYEALIRDLTDALRAQPKQEQGEIERLTAALEKANAQAEHFEREWYLRGDELEKLKQEQGEPYTIHTLHCVCGKTWQMDVYPPKLKENT